MNIDLHVRPTGKATAYAVFTQAQVDALRGEPGRGRVPVLLRFEGHEFRTSIAFYRGEWMFVVNQAMRGAGLLPGASYRVELVRDLEPTLVVPPADVLAALSEAPGTKAAWDGLAPSHRRVHLKHIEGAKRLETRQRRIAKLVDALLPDAAR